MNFILRYFRTLYAGIAVPVLTSRRHLGLLRMLVIRELVARNSGTVLGKVWPILQPALQMVGFWFLFDIVYGMRLVRGPSFLEYLLTGIVPWFCLSEILGRATQMFREYSNLYRRSLFPVEVLPVLIMLVPGFVFTLVYAVICGLLYGPLSGLAGLTIIPLLLLWLLPFTYLFSVLGVFIRDFANAMPILLMFMMYATPILYFPDMLPDSVRQWIWINPFSDLMLVIHAMVELQPLPVKAIARLALLWLVLLAPAWLIFRRSLPHVREVL